MIPGRQMLTVASICAVLTLPLVLADPGYGGDAPGDPLYARSTLEPGNYTGNMTAGDVDWYRIAVPALTRATVTMTPKCTVGQSNDFNLGLYRSDGASLAATTSAAGTCGTESATCVADFNEILYIRVGHAAGVADYNFSIDYASFAIPSGPADLCDA